MGNIFGKRKLRANQESLPILETDFVQQIDAILIQQFQQDVLNAKNLDPLPLYFHRDVIEHSPYVPADGIGPLTSYLDTYFEKATEGDDEDFQYKPQHVVSDGNLVFMYSKLVIGGGGEGGGKIMAVVDVYEMHKGKVKEHWDVKQDATEALEVAAAAAKHVETMSRGQHRPANRHPFF